MSTESTEMGGGRMFPAPRKDATLAELEDIYKEWEESDAPVYLKEQVLVELADRIRDYGTVKKEPEPMGEGVWFSGAPLEKVAKSGFRGKVVTEDGPMKAAP